ncbi:MAG: O-methyltransferase [bacterium]
MKKNRDMFAKKWHTPEIIRYVEESVGREESDLKKVLARTEEKGLGNIQISALEGRILECLAKACQAKKAVEIGTLGGYSAHWIARGLVDGGRLYTLEKDPLNAGVAMECVRESNLSKKISVMEGDALETLSTVSKLGPFDFCFIDADKVNYPFYIKWAVKNLRSGGIMAADNAFLGGRLNALEEAAGEDAQAIRAMREFFHILTDTASFSSCAVIPTGEGMAIGVR